MNTIDTYTRNAKSFLSRVFNLTPPLPPHKPKPTLRLLHLAITWPNTITLHDQSVTQKNYVSDLRKQINIRSTDNNPAKQVVQLYPSWNEVVTHRSATRSNAIIYIRQVRMHTNVIDLVGRIITIRSAYKGMHQGGNKSGTRAESICFHLHGRRAKK